jgi:hypothetical protein
MRNKNRNRKDELVSLSEYARRRGLSAKSVSQMAADGRIMVEGKRGNALLVSPASADRDRRASRMRVSGSDRGLLAKAMLAALRVKHRIKRDRLEKLRGRYVDARAGVAARAETLKVAVAALDDQAVLQELERAVIAAADQSVESSVGHVRTALIAWSHDLLHRTAEEVAAVAARTEAEAVTNNCGEFDIRPPQADTLTAWRAALLYIETLERRVRHAIAQGELISRDRSLAAAAEIGVTIRRAVESISASAVEISEAAHGGTDVVREFLANRLEAIRADIERLDPRSAGEGKKFGHAAEGGYLEAACALRRPSPKGPLSGQSCHLSNDYRRE